MGKIMAIWAIVPVKPFRRGKSRLAAALDEENRMSLNHCLVENTLETLKSIPEIEHVLVVSRDPQVLSLARACKARTIQESGSPQLNQALERASLFARRNAVRTVLVVPADLPFINSLDIVDLLQLGKTPPIVVISPDRHRKGTNALLISPPDLLKFQFGEDSFQKHVNQAIQSRARLAIFERPALALDLDLPEDLLLVRHQMQALDDMSLVRYSGADHAPAINREVEFETSPHPCTDTMLSLQIGDRDAKFNPENA